MRLEYSDGADEDLATIRQVLAERSDEAADRFSNAVLRRLRQVALFPNSGRIAPGSEHVRVRELVEGDYIISYAVGPETIIVLGVTHAARDR